MSESDERRPAGTPDEAELLALVLAADAGARARRDELARDPAVAARLSELEGFVTRCREWAVCEERQAVTSRAGALTAEVLARTTRADVSRAGDLRLLGGFLRARLRASLALRVAAASLLVHLLALPVVALMVWSEPTPDEPLILFDLPRTDDPFAREEPEPEPVLESPLGDPEVELAALDAERADPVLYLENSLRLARLHLGDGAPDPAGLHASGRAAELLRARCACLRGEAAPTTPARAAETGESVLLLALRVELALDVTLTRGTAPAGLAETLEHLAAGLLDAAETSDAEALLGAAALARAEAYGRLPETALTALERARYVAGGNQGAGALLGLSGEARDVAPLDPRWRSALVRALPGHEARGEFGAFLGVGLDGR